MELRSGVVPLGAAIHLSQTLQVLQIYVVIYLMVQWHHFVVMNVALLQIFVWHHVNSVHHLEVSAVEKKGVYQAIYVVQMIVVHQAIYAVQMVVVHQALNAVQMVVADVETMDTPLKALHKLLTLAS